jgi:SAM-dependent methyltransferase
MTPEMIVRSQAAAARLSFSNVEFRQGYLENLPVPDATIDVVISNCVINLAPEKSVVFREIARVLRPGGRLAVSDVVSNGPVPQALRDDPETWGACLGGALDFREFERGLLDAGLRDVQVTPKPGGPPSPAASPKVSPSGVDSHTSSRPIARRARNLSPGPRFRLRARAGQYELGWSRRATRVRASASCSQPSFVLDRTI